MKVCPAPVSEHSNGNVNLNNKGRNGENDFERSRLTILRTKYKKKVGYVSNFGR